MRKALNFLVSLFFVLAITLPLFGQGAVTQPVVGNKYPLGSVQATGTGDLWTTAKAAVNYSNAIIHWVTAGSPNACTLHILTGPTAALATLAVDDPNYAITCTSSGEKVVSAINSFININVYALQTGQGKSVTVYVTLTNFAANALNQTLSTVAQGVGAASPGALPWYTRLSDGTNVGPVGDALARSIYIRPGNGTTGFLDMAAGVGTQGAGVQQTATLGTLSSAVASATDAQVVAAPGTGSIVLLGVFLEKATNSTGTATVEYGTGSNCGTNKTTILTLGPATGSSPLHLGSYPINALVVAQKALCLVTDGSGTSIRALTE